MASQHGRKRNGYSSLTERKRFQQFLAHLSDRGRRQKTLSDYAQDWNAFARWSHETNGEPFDLTRLTAREVSEFKSFCQVRGQAPATINRRLVFIKQYVRYGFERGFVRHDIYQGVKDLPLVKTQPLAPKSLNPKEVRRYLKEVDLRASVRDRALIYLLLYTGLRVGELVHLKREDVLLSPLKGTLIIRSDHAKGGKERKVPIPLEARKALLAYLEQRREQGDEMSELFIGERGPLHEDAVAKIVRKYANFARVAASPHTLRHTFSYHYLHSNPDDLVGLADILGHENLQTTRRYTKKRLEDLEEGIEKVRFG